MSSDLPFLVCFEVEPTAPGFDQYLAIAKGLRPALDRIPGFQWIERSRSVKTGTRVLSLSYWTSEEALVSWRSYGAHHEAQIIGRNELFVDYRLRVGQVVRRWTPESIATSPEPGHGETWLGILRLDSDDRPDDQIAGFERYESMVNPGRSFLVTTLEGEEAGRAIETQLARTSTAQIVFDTCRIFRDYGRFERSEAPQHFPPIARP